MAEDGRLAWIAGRSALASATEPSLSDLLDPVALEERLREARARRTEALARRPDGAAPHDPPPAPVSQPAAEAPATPRRAAAAVPILIFLAGLGLGGAVVAVLALRALPARVASTTDFTPAAAVAPVAPADTPAIAPVVAAAPPASAAAPPDAAPAIAAPQPSAPAETLALRDPAGLAAPASEAAPPPASALPRLDAALPPAPPAATPAAQPALPARVYIHFPPSAAETAAAARDTLRAAGVAEVEIVPVRYAIARSNIRYYHDGDREPAAALAPLLAAALDGAAPEARDFTDYATPAAPGNVEIWLAGNPAGSAARAATTRRTAPATPTTAPDTPFQMPGVIAPPPTQAEQVERILIERLRQGR